MNCCVPFRRSAVSLKTIVTIFMRSAGNGSPERAVRVHHFGSGIFSNASAFARCSSRRATCSLSVSATDDATRFSRGCKQRALARRVNYRARQLLTYFRETFGFQPGDFPFADPFGNETISLPFYVNMPSGEHVPVVREALKDLLEGSA